MDNAAPQRGVPIADAAEQLGVTIELLRKRAQRKTIPAYKVDGRWYVVLDGVQDWTPGHDQDRTSSPGRDESRPPVVSPAAMAQLEAVRDQWLQPLVSQIREQAEHIGRLAAERAAIARERDDLADRLAADRGLADQLVNVLQAERDQLRADLERLQVSRDPVTEHRAEQVPTEGGLRPGPWARLQRRLRGES